MAYKAGDRLCGCTLKQKCGEGAYGEVWLAEDPVGARVALKIILIRGRYSERELAGLKNYRDCNHPNLLKIRHVEITGDRVCYTMDAADDLDRGQGEYLPDTLANRLRKSGRLEAGEITALLEGLLAGLEELHKHGLVHRDVKPDNILWVNGRPTLADAGLIAPEGKGSFAGTPGFMSPKLMSGKGSADASDDFYALGKVVYCALTGLPVGEYPSIPKNMTISAGAGLNRVLRESCSRPIPSAAEFRKLLTEEGGAPRVVVMPGNNNSREKRLFLLLTALILVCAGIAVFLIPGKTKPPARYVDELPPDSKEAVELDKTLQAAQKQIGEFQRQLARTLALPRKTEELHLNDLRSRIATVLREEHLLPGDGTLCEKLLTYGELWLPTSPGNPEIFSLGVRYTSALSPKELTERRKYWRGKNLPAKELQKAMLETDRVMQAAALDLLIREAVAKAPPHGPLPLREKSRLEQLFRLRHEAAHPHFYRFEFLQEPDTSRPTGDRTL